MGFQWEQLSHDGETVVLRKFKGDFSLPIMEAGKARRALVLDVETTGLNSFQDKVIECAMTEIYYDVEFNRPVGIGESYQGFQDPGFPLSKEIIDLTGITDADVEGQHLDFPKMQSMFDSADIIIAHNAAFDRPFMDRLFRNQYVDKVWGCSVTQVNWRRHGYGIAKLDVLTAFHGFYVDAHRAVNDVNALTQILITEKAGDFPYFSELLSNAFSTAYHVLAVGSPFEKKDLLKKRGYRWNAAERVWHIQLSADALEDEQAYLATEIYGGRGEAVIREIKPKDRFKRV